MAACPVCTHENVPDAVFCAECGNVVGYGASETFPWGVRYVLVPVLPETNRSWAPIAGGALAVAGGGIGLASSIVAAFSFQSVTLAPFGSASLICGGVGIAFSIAAILSGYLAIRGRYWAFALAGAILGIFTPSVLCSSSLLCLVGFFLLASSRNEFAS